MLWALVYSCLEQINHVQSELGLLHVSSGSPALFGYKNEVIVIPSAQRPCEGCPPPPQSGVQGMCRVPLDKTLGIWAWQMVQECWDGAGEPWRLARAFNSNALIQDALTRQGGNEATGCVQPPGTGSSAPA